METHSSPQAPPPPKHGDLFDAGECLRGRIIDSRRHEEDEREYLVQWVPEGGGTGDEDWVIEAALVAEFPEDVLTYKMAHNILATDRAEEGGGGGGEGGLVDSIGGEGSREGGKTEQGRIQSGKQQSNKIELTPLQQRRRNHREATAPFIPPACSEKEQLSIQYFYKILAIHSGVQGEVDSLVKARRKMAAYVQSMSDPATAPPPGGGEVTLGGRPSGGGGGAVPGSGSGPGSRAGRGAGSGSGPGSFMAHDMLGETAAVAYQQKLETEGLDRQLRKLENMRKAVKAAPPSAHSLEQEVEQHRQHLKQVQLSVQRLDAQVAEQTIPATPT